MARSSRAPCAFGLPVARTRRLGHSRCSHQETWISRDIIFSLTRSCGVPSDPAREYTPHQNQLDQIRPPLIATSLNADLVAAYSSSTTMNTNPSQLKKPTAAP